MTTLAKKLAQVREARKNLDTIIGVAVLSNSSNILRDVRGQLWDGKNGKGNDITPSYLDDPYFKTRRDAEGYAKWKQSITPNSNRAYYAPNLFINGYFHENLTINPQTLSMDVTQWGREIIKKYGESTFALAATNTETINALRKDIIKNYKDYARL